LLPCCRHSSVMLLCFGKWIGTTPRPSAAFDPKQTLALFRTNFRCPTRRRLCFTVADEGTTRPLAPGMHG
jgi:hypothetical protein